MLFWLHRVSTMYSEYLFVGFTSCQTMNFWRFCPRPKIRLLCNRTCANALRTLHGFVLARCFIRIFCLYIIQSITFTCMWLRLLLALSFSSSQIYRSHICTLERGRRWSSSCQCSLLETWRTGSGMSKNLWRPHWGIALTAHSKSTLRSATLTLTLMC